MPRHDPVNYLLDFASIQGRCHQLPWTVKKKIVQNLPMTRLLMRAQKREAKPMTGKFILATNTRDSTLLYLKFGPKPKQVLPSPSSCNIVWDVLACKHALIRAIQMAFT